MHMPRSLFVGNGVLGVGYLLKALKNQFAKIFELANSNLTAGRVGKWQDIVYQ